MNTTQFKYPIITLLTDFGLQDIYVGVMKGIIAQINPDLNIIDLSNNIPRQNILAARFALMNAINYFPVPTIYLVVVDPCVGSNRKAIAVACERGYLIGPDNGVFDGVLSLYPATEVYELNNPDYWLSKNPSSTFHGRDIFAPVSAHVGSGVKLNHLGNKISQDSLIKVNLPNYKTAKNYLIGYIQYIDIYGNLITNIPASALTNKLWYVQESQGKIPRGNSYNDVAINQLVALIGSHGWLEIAVNGGSAAKKLHKSYIDGIKVQIS